MWGFNWSEFAGESAKKIMDFRTGGMYFYGGIAELFFWELCSAVSARFLSAKWQILLAWDSSLCR